MSMRETCTATYLVSVVGILVATAAATTAEDGLSERLIPAFGYSQVVFSPKSDWIANYGGTEDMQVWKLEGKSLKPIARRPKSGSIGVSDKEGKVLVVAEWSPTGQAFSLLSFELDTGKEKFLKTLTGPFGLRAGITFSPNGRYVGIHREPPGDSLEVWGVSENKMISTVPSTGVVQAAISNLGNVAIAKKAEIAIYRPGVAKPTMVLPPVSDVMSIAFSPNDDALAVGCQLSPKAAGVVLYDLKKGEKTRTFAAQKAAFPLAFSEDGRLLATGDIEVLRIFNVETGREAASVSGASLLIISSIRFAPNGKTIAVSSTNAIRIWDLEYVLKTKEIVLPPPEHKE